MDFSTNKFSSPFLAEKFPGSFGTTGCWDKHRLFVTDRAIYVEPSHENARTNQEQQTNRNRAIWLVYRTDTNVGGCCWLSKRSSCPKNFLEIDRYLTLTSYCNMTGQSNNAFSILGFPSAGKQRGHVLKTFIHWVMKQITNTYRNHFSRSYENRSKDSFHVCNLAAKLALKISALSCTKFPLADFASKRLVDYVSFTLLEICYRTRPFKFKWNSISSNEF